jgi:hypothetical protein
MRIEKGDAAGGAAVPMAHAAVQMKMETGPSSFWPRAQRPPSLRRNKDVSKCLSHA